MRNDRYFIFTILRIFFKNFSPTQNVYLQVGSVKGLRVCQLEQFGSLPVDYSYLGLSATLNFEFCFGSELDSVPWFLLKDELDADWSSKSSFLSQTHRARGDDEEKKWEGPPYRVKPQPSLFSSRLMFAYQSKSRGQSQFKK